MQRNLRPANTSGTCRSCSTLQGQTATSFHVGPAIAQNQPLLFVSLPRGMSEPESFQFDVESDSIGIRLDAFLAVKMPQFSRTSIRRAINDGGVSVDGASSQTCFQAKRW